VRGVRRLIAYHEIKAGMITGLGGITCDSLSHVFNIGEIHLFEQ
jgi:hypothetical protein